MNDPLAKPIDQVARASAIEVCRYEWLRAAPRAKVAGALSNRGIPASPEPAAS